MEFLSFFVLLILHIFKSVIIAKIAAKAGYGSPIGFFWISLIPIGDALCLIYIAFTDFPKVKELAVMSENYKSEIANQTWKLRVNESERIKRENQAYALVSEEISTNCLDKGIWLKAETMHMGDEARVKTEYVKLRVESLMLGL